MKYICCLILFFTVLLPSCQWGRQEAFFPDEGLAERLLRENPDSLAMILEEQVIPSELSGGIWLVDHPAASTTGTEYGE